jgi:Polysaccharide lyase
VLAVVGGAALVTAAPADVPPDLQAGWNGGASRPLVDEWASYTEAGRPGVAIDPDSRPSRITQVVKDGRRAYRLRVLGRDRDRFTSDSQRTELAQGNPARTFADGTGDRKMRAGDDRWVAERILIPKGVVSGARGYSFFVLNQFKLDGPGGPAAALSFEDERLVVSRAGSRAAWSAQQRTLGSTGIVPRDRWVGVVWHVRWSRSDDGLIEVFIDAGDGFERIVRYGGWTLKRKATAGPAAIHPRIGIYRRAIRRNTSVYIAGFNVATSRSAAQAAAAASVVRDRAS